MFSRGSLKRGAVRYAFSLKRLWALSARRRVAPTPVVELGPVSPGGHWILAFMATGTEDHPVHFATIPTAGGNIRPICYVCAVGWSADGRYLVIGDLPSRMAARHKTYLIPLAKGEDIPPLPSGGFKSDKEIAGLPDARVIDQGGVEVGMNPGIYAYMDLSVHRNLYRIPLL